MRVEPKSGEISHLMSKLGNSKYWLLHPSRRVPALRYGTNPKRKSVADS